MKILHIGDLSETAKEAEESPEQSKRARLQLVPQYNGMVLPCGLIQRQIDRHHNDFREEVKTDGSTKTRTSIYQGNFEAR